MARALSRLLRRHIFKIATFVALAAVVVSGVGTYRALDALPGLQRQVLVIEDGLQRMLGLRGALGVAAANARLLGRGDQDAVAREMADAASRGLQLAEEMLAAPVETPLRSLVESSQRQLLQLSELAANPSRGEETSVTELSGQIASARAELLQQIASGREELVRLRDAASSARSEAVYQLLGGHALILGVIGLLYFARDAEVRRRERSDSLLLEADERFALIVRGSADGIILANASGRIETTNPALDEMFGADENQLVGQTVGALFETTLIDEWLSSRGAVELKPTTHRTVVANRCDGGHFDAELSITHSVIRDQEFLAISVRDVTDREVSRVRLMQQEALLGEIPEPLLILDAGENIVFWNLGAQNLYGYTPEEAIGHSVNDLLRVVLPDGESDNVHSIQYGDAQRWTGELRATAKSGQTISIERRLTKIMKGDSVIGEVILDLDLGERTQVQVVERRRQRLEALGTLASGVAHDLNNLLTPILMSSRMLQRGGDRLDSLAMLETIATSASRAAELIAQLLTFARGGKGQHVPIDVGMILNEVGGILHHTLGPSIRLEVQVEPELPSIRGDATEVSQVIMNLAINSRDAMPEGGTLLLAAKRMTLNSEKTYSLVTLQPGDYVAISVSDNGAGIPTGIRDRIFDPFFTTKEIGQGTGLGLSTSLGIVRGHHGAVDVSSQVGQGTVVTVILPVIS